MNEKFTQCGPWWHRNTFLLVTGASQGIGREIALQFSTKLNTQGSIIVLLARSKTNLDKTKQMIVNLNPELEVRLEVEDLTTPNKQKMKEMFSKYISKENEQFEFFILVHGAGTEGNGSLASDLSDLEEWQSYMTLNLHSMAMLTSCFLKSTPSGLISEAEERNKKRRLIINLTSLAAIQPIKGLGYYCVSKAAREMYLKVLAEENPELEILNYSPGPVGTDMVDRVIKKLKDPDTKKIFEEMKSDRKLVNIEETVGKLVALLSSPNPPYKSGGRVDFFDK